ncbi:MAG TPA: molybdopterin-dependent oxidoreductase [Acetobacteraceae bacterium]|nr:molybdopterin-dependent oxidoreductase [Acetobacteraceae bacterium]
MSNALTRRSFSLLPLLLCAGSSAVALAGKARAATLPAPTGATILTISGKIANTNDHGRAVFDRAMLESLGMETVTSKTPWYKEACSFEGISLAKLMRYVGASGDRIIATALNDYSSELPISDFTQYGTILALKRNGEYLPVSDKGPLFIIYPFDSNPFLQQDRFYMRSVWQVYDIQVK